MLRLQHPTLGTFEGTPEEVADALARLRDAGVLDAPLEPLVTIARKEETVQARLRDVPNNELILHDYAHAPGLVKKTRIAYVNSAREFERILAPKSFLDATHEDARKFERRCLDACGHLRSTVFGEGGKATNVQRFTCNAGVFRLLGAPPPTCSRECDKWKKQSTGPVARLKALKHFYEFLRKRRLVTENIFTDVVEDRGKVRSNTVVKKKYSPTPGEVRELISMARLIATPLEVCAIMALAKWGRRPAHTMDLMAEEIVGIITKSEEGAFADFSGVKERFDSRQGDGTTKLLGFLVSPIDAEFESFLRHDYFPWRQERYGYAWDEGPFLPGKLSSRPMHEEQIGEILDRLMRALVKTARTDADRARWKAHLEDKKKRITAGTFRHYASTMWRQLGLEETDRDILRGDVPKATRATYEHITPRDICAMYRSDDLLAAE